MSTTKRLSVKAAKPQDQTCASQVQTLIDHILEDQTTGLSDATDAAVINSSLFGTAALKVEGSPVGGYTYTPYPNNTTTNTITVSNSNSHSRINMTYPRLNELTRDMLETHPVFELTVEQLRAAWMIEYGSRWVSLNDVCADEYMDKVHFRLRSLGELEVHNVIDQYAPMARIKV